MREEHSFATVSVPRTGLSEVVDFDVRSDLGEYSVFEALADVFTPPEHQAIHRPNTGRTALVLDGCRIRRALDRILAALKREHRASD